MIALAMLFSNDVFSLSIFEPNWKTAFKADLIVGESVQFREITKSSLLDITCGDFNAKNALGAYTGWKEFSVWELDGDYDRVVNPTGFGIGIQGELLKPLMRC